MILAQCEHPRWKTRFHHNFLSQEGWGGVVVVNAYVTLCLSPFSPQGVKARRAMSMKREKGCDGCSNRWDESSVLVRYALLLSCCPCLFCFLSFFTTLAFLCPSSVLFNFSVFHVTFSSLLICQFRFCFSLFLRLFFLCLPPFTSLPTFSFTVCLVLEMLPKTTSTLCFLLLTLECKKQREKVL